MDAVVVMGATGVGKTTVGRALAERLGVPFLDADDLHPAANVAKMSRGEQLGRTSPGSRSTARSRSAGS